MPKSKYDFSEAAVRKNRTFPVGQTVLLAFCVLLQLFLIFIAVIYNPSPQDVIKEYEVTVEPLEDGTLDIEYSFYWKALDETEPLTWVEIGLANSDYTIYDDSISDNIKGWRKVNEDGYVALELHFKDKYYGGDTLRFSFKINQGSMLCEDEDEYFYEFVPGWFNSTPVEHYEFKWLKDDNITSAKGAKEKGDYYVWSGEFECGDYELMRVEYDEYSFIWADTTYYREFNDSGCSNDLAGDKVAFCVFIVIIVLVILAVEINIIDCYVSYVNGRGFRRHYGHYVHVYGRTNPHYRTEANRRAASSRSYGGGGGGCACACACACAGGGRAGCSQKDTYSNTIENALVKKYWR